jgi:hypothetical protein
LIAEDEYAELKILGYDKPHCVDHLNPELAKPTEARASWQHSESKKRIERNQENLLKRNDNFGF